MPVNAVSAVKNTFHCFFPYFQNIIPCFSNNLSSGGLLQTHCSFNAQSMLMHIFSFISDGHKKNAAFFSENSVSIMFDIILKFLVFNTSNRHSIRSADVPTSTCLKICCICTIYCTGPINRLTVILNNAINFSVACCRQFKR